VSRDRGGRDDDFSFRAAADRARGGPALLDETGEVLVDWGTLARRAEEASRESARISASPPTAPVDAFVPRLDPTGAQRVLSAVVAGRPIAPVHPRLPEPERERRLVLARARLAAGAARRAAVAVAPPPAEARPLAALFTSGTSGAAKLAQLSRGAFLASARASAEVLPFGPGDRWLLAMPLAHVGGLSILTRALFGGGGVVLGGAFETGRVLRALAAARVTHASLVPTMLRRILDQGARAPDGLRVVLLGGAAAPDALVDEALDRGWPIHRTYGLTEACSQVATEPRPGAGLRPLPGVVVAVGGPEGKASDRDAGHDRVGEVEVGGPILFDGYLEEDGRLERPGRGADGSFPTGDLGRLRADGVLEIVGRRDDVIVTGGENVHPGEVEAVLAAVPGAGEVVVLGLPDPTWGDRVVAVWERAAGPEAGLGARLEAQARAALAPHQRPKELIAVPVLPRTPTGKVDRRALRRQLRETAGRAG